MRYPNQIERWRRDESRSLQLAAEASASGNRKAAQRHFADAKLAKWKRHGAD
jgi:hypothetical protein